MPYIKKQERVSALVHVARNPGELNFQLTTAVNEYLTEKKLSYQTINDIIGALEGAKMEFYRRIAVPYENEKLSINGDVYGSEEKN